MNTSQALTQGIHHFGLTVPDLAAAQTFFVDALRFVEVGAKADYPAVFLSDGNVMVTLWQARRPATATPFDRHQGIGLHHAAFRVRDLDAVHEILRVRADTSIEFAPELLGAGPSVHMMCTIPGGIRIEFIQPATA